MSSSANKSAADTVAQSSREAAILANEGIDKQIAATREGNAQAQATLDRIRENAAPATSYLRGIVGQVEGLTPAQQAALDEQRRLAPDHIRRSGFAGSGRTAASILRRVEADTVNQMMDINRGRRDAAAGQMASASDTAAGQVAAMQAGLGQQVGQAYAQQGMNTGQSVASAGNAMAGADVANAKVAGQTIGDIASIINSERKSKYGSGKED